MEEQNKEILNKFEILLSSIKQSPDYQRYLVLKKKLNSNNDIKMMIQNVKTLQKEIVKKEYHSLPTIEEEQKINKILTELDKIPLYKEYTYVVSDLNYLINYVKEEIEKCINEKI